MSRQTKMEKMLLHAGRMLTSTLDYEELMKLVLELTIKATDAVAALVYRLDKDEPVVRGRFLRAGEEEVQYYKLKRGEGIIGWVAENREPQVVHDVLKDPRFSPRLEEFLNIKFRSVLAVPLIGRGQMIGVIEAVNKIGGEFDDIDLDTLVGLANQFAVAIDNANLYREANRRAVEQQLLYEVSKKLSSTLNIDEVLQQILDSLKKVVGYTAGGVFLLNEAKGEVSTIYSDGYDPDHDKYLELKIGQGLVGWVARTGEPVIVPDVTKDDRYISALARTKSEIVAPIKIDGRILGVLNLESDRPANYDKHSLELLTAFASHAAISIERATLHENMIRSQRIQEQLNIARQIQLTFLPEKEPVIPGYDVSGINIPSGEVGGDYFDFLKIIDNQTGIAIADVSGKGIPAALLMASFRASLIAEIRNNYAIRTICSKVNSLMYESVEQGNYVTAFYGVLDSKNNIFTFSNCGHNRPILLRYDGSIEYLREGGLAMGIMPDSKYEERPIFLRSGDTIVFYTDGVTEVNNPDGAEFGEGHLVEALLEFKDLKAREIHRHIYQKIKSFAASDHTYDDLTMIVLKKL
ncbi:MAG: SpoIIE family protein phosphatase [Candidatus Zixiibacteriota bacterium]